MPEINKKFRETYLQIQHSHLGNDTKCIRITPKN